MNTMYVCLHKLAVEYYRVRCVRDGEKIHSSKLHTLSYALGGVELKNAFFHFFEPSKFALFDKNGFFIFSLDLINLDYVVTGAYLIFCS